MTIAARRRWGPALWSLLLLAACSGPAEEDKAPDPVALVRTAPVEAGTASDAVTIYGVAEAGPSGQRAVIAPVEAILNTVAAPAGTAVRAGQVIATLRPSPGSRLELSKANTDAAAATAALERARRLRADGLASDAEVETARAAAASAGASRTSLAAGVGGLSLRAPVAGTVQALVAKPGEQVAAGSAIASIAAGGELRARFGVDPVLARRVHAGQPLQISPVSGGAALTATVAGVDPQVDATTRLASVFARLPAALGAAAGQPLRARLPVGAASTGLTIPYAALLDDGGRAYVFVVAGGVARRRDVTPGNSAGERITVLKGLSTGERVVTEGGTGLEDGIKVHEAAAPR